jgi:hypothetical protein
VQSRVVLTIRTRFILGYLTVRNALRYIYLYISLYS